MPIKDTVKWNMGDFYLPFIFQRVILNNQFKKINQGIPRSRHYEKSV